MVKQVTKHYCIAEKLYFSSKKKLVEVAREGDQTKTCSSVALVKQKNGEHLLKRGHDDSLAGSSGYDYLAIDKDEHGDAWIAKPEDQSRKNLSIEFCPATRASQSKTESFEAKRRIDITGCNHVVNGHALDFASRVGCLADGANVHTHALLQIF